MDVTFFYTRIKFSLVFMIITAILNGCGGSGGGSTDPDTGGGTQDADATLVSLNFDRTSNILPGSMIAQSTVRFTAEGKNSAGAFVDLSKAVTWTTSNPSVVTVNASGLATAIAPGQAKITASLNSAEVKQAFSQGITVKAAKMVIGSKTKMIFEKESLQLSVAAKFIGGGSLDTGDNEVWSISDPGVASIDDTGLITALAPGDITVTATYLSLMADFSLTISKEFILTASGVGLNQIVLDWPVVSGADSYTLERKTTGNLGGFIRFPDITLMDTQYVHSGLDSDTHYVYVVTAVENQPVQANKIVSNEVAQNTLSNNSAVLTGDPIGAVTAPTVLTELRHSVQVTLATSNPILMLGNAFIMRNSTSATSLLVIIPVTNTSADGNLCGIEMKAVKYRDNTATDVVTPIQSDTLLTGGMKMLSADVPDSRCLSPGASGYFLSFAFVDAATAQADFHAITEVYAASLDVLYGNRAVNTAIIPQSYTVTPVADSSNQRIDVLVSNFGSVTGTVKTYSKYILLN